MADSKAPEAEISPSAAASSVKAAKPQRPPNPVWRMMGLPNMRLRLPSRNWMIFLSITGSITAAVIYDKREKNRVQRKWCKLVEHLAMEPIDPKTMPRKLTVFLEAPPADGLRTAQDYFKDYVKPVLVSSGLDWDFIQGRKEGDVRAELAKRIRHFRLPELEALEDEEPIAKVRRQNGTKEFDGPQGDIVIGRNTWKEYVRGLHEGWLGPITAPTPAESGEAELETPIETLPGITIHSTPTEAPSETPTETKGDSGSEKPKKPPQPPPFISTSKYSSAETPANLPSEFDPSVPINFPHVLGFLNTATRIYRFFNRRYLADAIGRETAAIVLSTSRPYRSNPSALDSSDSPSFENENTSLSEQATALAGEEKDWHKSIHKHEDGERERTWLDDIVLDPRIADRMRRAELTPEDEERARRIVVTEEEIEGWIKGSIRHMWRHGKESILGPPKKHQSELVEDELLD